MQSLETLSSTDCQDSLNQTPRPPPVLIQTWDMDGPPLRTPPRPLIDDIDEPPPRMSTTRDPTYEAKRNQKKAVLAWSSWQRFVGSCEPLVRLLEITYALLPQLWTWSLAAKTTPAMNVKSVARVSRAIKTIGMARPSTNAAANP